MIRAEGEGRERGKGRGKMEKGGRRKNEEGGRRARERGRHYLSPIKIRASKHSVTSPPKETPTRTHPEVTDRFRRHKGKPIPATDGK